MQSLANDWEGIKTIVRNTHCCPCDIVCNSFDILIRLFGRRVLCILQ